MLPVLPMLPMLPVLPMLPMLPMLPVLHMHMRASPHTQVFFDDVSVLELGGRSPKFEAKDMSLPSLDSKRVCRPF